MKLHHTSGGLVADTATGLFLLPRLSLDDVFTHDDPLACIEEGARSGQPIESLPASLRAPIQSQEVWAAGVTYRRSRSARMEEAEAAGGGSFYDRVYAAARPELFFKAAPHRVVGPGEAARIRSDSEWDVPEPELTLAISSRGQIFGCTIGNDMSSRSIEGENPLYLPQAKVYDGCAALGPCLLLGRDLPGPATAIRLRIERGGTLVFEGETTLGEIKRPFPELRDYLFRDNSFPFGAYLMTGTGIVPGREFTLRPGDRVAITIDGIGTLENPVARSRP